MRSKHAHSSVPETPTILMFQKTQEQQHLQTFCGLNEPHKIDIVEESGGCLSSITQERGDQLQCISRY
jgi:hypothetical protein